MDTTTHIDRDWPYVLTFFPDDGSLRRSAREYGALIRRRGVDSAATVLRLGLAYAVGDKSLRQTSAWAEGAKVASLSDVALLNRLRNSASWFGHPLALKLVQRGGIALPPPGPWKIRLVDATCVSSPGATGTEWRAHLSWDLGRGIIDHVELTDEHGGESLTRFACQPGDLLIGDRGYVHRRGLAWVRDAGADFIVRMTWNSLPLELPDGTPFPLFDALRGLDDCASGDFRARTGATRETPSIDARVVAIRKSPEAAKKARARILRDAGGKRNRIDPRTLEAADYIFVVTSLGPEVSAAEVLELYRLRWQVELTFKRLKGIGAFDALRAHDADLARAYLICKLLAALVIDELSEAHLAFSPWGFRIRRATALHVADLQSVP